MTKEEFLLIERLIDKSIQLEVSKLEAKLVSKYEAQLIESKQNVVKLAKAIKVLKESNSNVGNRPLQSNFIDNSNNRQTAVEKADVADLNEFKQFYAQKSTSHVPRVDMNQLQNGEIPDFDAPVFFDRNSEVMQGLMEKLGD